MKKPHRLVTIRAMTSKLYRLLTFWRRDLVSPNRFAHVITGTVQCDASVIPSRGAGYARTARTWVNEYVGTFVASWA